MRTVLTIDSAKIAMAVKMLPTYTWTKRPRGALLQSGIELFSFIVENRRDGSDLSESVSGIPLLELNNSHLFANRKRDSV